MDPEKENNEENDLNTNNEEKDLDTDNDTDKITVSQYLEENNISSGDFFGKLLPKLQELDFNNIRYKKSFLNELINGD